MQRKEVTINGADNLKDFKERLLEQFSVMDILVALTDGLFEKYEFGKGAPPTQQRRWDELLDLMYHFDGGEGRRNNEAPRINPLILIKRLQKEGIIPGAEAQALTANFTKAVRNAAGTDLNEEQVQALFTLFLNFDISKERESLKPGIE